MRITVIGECTHPAVLVKPFSPGSGITFVLGHVLATPLRAGMTLHRHGTDMAPTCLSKSLNRCLARARPSASGRCPRFAPGSIGGHRGRLAVVGARNRTGTLLEPRGGRVEDGVALLAQSKHAPHVTHILLSLRRRFRALPALLSIFAGNER